MTKPAFRLLIPAVLAAALALSPGLAEAKAGKSASQGSRGSRTYDSVAPATPAPAPTAPAGGFLQHGGSGSGSAAQPINRSVAPPAVKAAPAAPSVQSESLTGGTMAPGTGPVNPGGVTAAQRAQVGAGTALPGSPQPSTGRSFMAGLAGGLVGAGIGSLLFGGGHGFFGEGSGGFLGSMIQLAILFFVGRWLFNRFFGNRPVAEHTAYGRNDFAPREPSFAPREPGFDPREPQLRVVNSPIPTVSVQPQKVEPPKVDREFALGEHDLATFEQLLVEIQTAWTNGDSAALQRMATPEMAGYLNEQLQGDRQHGLHNRVEQVRLLRGDVNETWREGEVVYATVTLQWSAVDYTVKLATNEVVEGDARRATEATEVWTLLKSPGAPWILSAIQQT